MKINLLERCTDQIEIHLFPIVDSLEEDLNENDNQVWLVDRKEDTLQLVQIELSLYLQKCEKEMEQIQIKSVATNWNVRTYIVHSNRLWLLVHHFQYSSRCTHIHLNLS